MHTVLPANMRELGLISIVVMLDLISADGGIVIDQCGIVVDDLCRRSSIARHLHIAAHKLVSF